MTVATTPPESALQTLPEATTPPVILVGMHRSGTSLLARMLDDLGLFLGWRLGPDHEATYFNKLNEWLLAAAGGRWDMPEAVRYLRSDPRGIEHACRHLADRLAAPPVLEFLGPRHYVRHRSVFSLNRPWGFKDPRSTVNLEIWCRLFPHAKVIHLVRHGVDVAHSLVRRQRQGQQLGYDNFRRHRRLFRWTGKRGWFGDSPRVGHLASAFELWEVYLQLAQPALEALPAHRLLELPYEALLQDPQPHLQRIAELCGLKTTAGALAAATAGVRADRAFSFRRHAELTAFAQSVATSPGLRRFGYGEVTSGGSTDGPVSSRYGD